MLDGFKCRLEGEGRGQGMAHSPGRRRDWSAPAPPCLPLDSAASPWAGSGARAGTWSEMETGWDAIELITAARGGTGGQARHVGLACREARSQRGSPPLIKKCQQRPGVMEMPPLTTTSPACKTPPHTPPPTSRSRQCIPSQSHQTHPGEAPALSGPRYDSSS